MNLNDPTCKSHIMQYYQGIKAGNIVAGYELMLMLGRLAREISDTGYQEENGIKVDFGDSKKESGSLKQNAATAKLHMQGSLSSWSCSRKRS